MREVAALCDLARARTGGWFDARRLPLPTGGAGFDPSGLVKGWAVQRAAGALADLDGHDLVPQRRRGRAAADPGGPPPWRVGVEDPDRPGLLLDVLDRRDGAVATSGTARRGAHIVDPRAGRPAPGCGRSPWSGRTCSGPTHRLRRVHHDDVGERAGRACWAGLRARPWPGCS